ncbi:nucleoside triphosphate hydrolase [Neotabrizicola shimadae]|uniref:Nucleoside triphosphate hydrolase n=1 Tax=Neotabrizicola shimadae TaxID=2807096 RepID=A0A8G1EBI9_9RHOB|nr:nucleoside triphosphate hydrolase [Neotabrizicola shimadae]QYZ68186.1 nucleoside triphosphate hydrolase [Neotabrizicola shimadae]
MSPGDLAAMIKARAAELPGRFLVGLAGPPGAGKSTLAAAVVAELGPGARVVPMDGFHYDDIVLNARGLRHRKGAPETFDVAGFLHLLDRLRDEEEVAIPIFDRSIEISRAAADVVMPSDRILVVEGNWLLLDEGRWAEAAGRFDLTVMLEVPEAELVRRLMERWATHGKTPAAARAWIEGNDLPNIRRVIEGSRPAEAVIRWS